MKHLSFFLLLLAGCVTTQLPKMPPTMPSPALQLTQEVSLPAKAMQMPATIQDDSQYACCPAPPDGYDCYEKPLAIATNPVPFEWSRFNDSLVFKHWITNGMIYEVQYCHQLSGPWYAYTRIVAPKTSILTTFAPIYLCDQRFYRVMSN